MRCSGMEMSHVPAATTTCLSAADTSMQATAVPPTPRGGGRVCRAKAAAAGAAAVMSD